MPLVSSSGAMVAMKGSSLVEEIRDAEPVLQRLGCTTPEHLVIGADLTDPPTHAVRVAWAGLPTVGLAAPPAGAGRGPKGPRGKKRR